MLRPSLQLRLGQQLTMTPQLQQAIRLLQLPALELKETIREALEQNVMLEIDEEAEQEQASLDALQDAPDERVVADADAPDPDESLEHAGDHEHEPSTGDDLWRDDRQGERPWSGGDQSPEFAEQPSETLHQHLQWQLTLAHVSAREHSIGLLLIDSINDDGYLADTIDNLLETLRPDVDSSVAEIESVLTLIQHFDPAGVGARSIGECIQLQLAQLDPKTPGRDLATTIAGNHLDLLATQQLAVLRRTLGVDDDLLGKATALVRACHPRPGSTIQPHRPDFVIPDVYVRRGPHGWLVDTNSAVLPAIRINPQYVAMVSRSADHAVLRSQLQEARWLLRSLEIRAETLRKVACCIIERQSAFLEHGEEFMQPMVLRDVADAIDMHESTVSRVTTGKYMHTPRGIFEFRHFFSSHVGHTDGTEVSSTAIRAKIRKLIAAEDPARPLSDSKLASLLVGNGVQVARRTVAKYREALQIAPSSERRRSPAR